MKPLSRVLAVLAIASATAAVPAIPVVAAGLAVAPNEPAPKLRGVLVEGGSTNVRWEDAKLTLVNFWATWCEPCRHEMPELQAWLDRWEPDGLRVYGVAKDPKKAPALIIAHLDGLGVDYPVFFAGDRISRLWGGIGTLPTTFLIDSEGMVVARFQGALPETLEAMRRRVAEELGVEDVAREASADPGAAAEPAAATEPDDRVDGVDDADDIDDASSGIDRESA